jgi:hypothetical protein
VSALSNLTNLQQLRIRRNQISDVSTLSNLTNLQQLLLEENPIRTEQVLSVFANHPNEELEIAIRYDIKVKDIDNKYRTEDISDLLRGKTPEDVKTVIQDSKKLQKALKDQGYFTIGDYIKGYNEVRQKHNFNLLPKDSISLAMTITNDLKFLIEQGYLTKQSVTISLSGISRKLERSMFKFLFGISQAESYTEERYFLV